MKKNKKGEKTKILVLENGKKDTNLYNAAVQKDRNNNSQTNVGKFVKSKVQADFDASLKLYKDAYSLILAELNTVQTKYDTFTGHGKNNNQDKINEWYKKNGEKFESLPTLEEDAKLDEK